MEYQPNRRRISLPEVVAVLVAIDGHAFPSSDPKTRWVLPATVAGTGYPFIRRLKVRYGGNGGIGSGQFLRAVAVKDPGWLNGPLFKAGYFEE